MKRYTGRQIETTYPTFLLPLSCFVLTREGPSVLFASTTRGDPVVLVPSCFPSLPSPPFRRKASGFSFDLPPDFF